jgi:aspartate/methionine/tyrosine aminotransferase
MRSIYKYFLAPFLLTAALCAGISYEALFTSSVRISGSREGSDALTDEANKVFYEEDEFERITLTDRVTNIEDESHNLELFLEPGNTDTFFYTGSGSAQIIYALVYAIATAFPNQHFLFVEKIPFYSGHHASVALLFHYPNARWQGFKHPDEIKLRHGETLIEFVTSPNNPDGVFRGPSTDAEIIFGDFVFSSSAYGDGTGFLQENLAWVRQARAAGKKLYSFNSSSKQFGKTGCRTGYIWFPLNDSFSTAIFPHFFNFISLSTIGSSTAGLSEFLDLISAFLERKDGGQKLRQDAFNSLIKRHDIVSKEVLQRYPGSSIVSVPGGPALFVRLSDERFPAKSAREIIFEDIRASVSGGVPFGETDEFFRVNLTGYSAELAQFTNRLAESKKYSPADFLISSKQVCEQIKICGSKKQNTHYIANPNNCVIKADAEDGPIVITLPEFIDYNASNIITIMKTDCSPHQVKVVSDNFTKILTRKSNQIQVEWQQPNFQNGKWRIIKD